MNTEHLIKAGKEERAYPGLAHRPGSRICPLCGGAIFSYEKEADGEEIFNKVCVSCRAPMVQPVKKIPMTKPSAWNECNRCFKKPPYIVGARWCAACAIDSNIKALGSGDDEQTLARINRIMAYL